MTGRESPDSAHLSGKRALPRLFTNVRYREEGTLSRTSRMGAERTWHLADADAAERSSST